MDMINDNDLKKLRSKIQELEDKLNDHDEKFIEQEHRFWKSLLHVIWFNKGDKKRKIAMWSAIRNGFRAGPGIAVLGGFIGIATLYLLYQQNKEIEKQTNSMLTQTTELRRQNNLLIEQNQQQWNQFAHQRLTDLTGILYDTTINDYTIKLKTEALFEYITLKRNQNPEQMVELNNAQLTGIKLYNCKLDSISLIGAKMDSVEIHHSELNWCDLNNVSMRGANITSTNFSDCNFEDANLSALYETKDCECPNTTFIFDSKFNSCFLVGLQITQASLRNCEFTNCKVTSLDIDKTILDNVRGLSGLDIYFTTGVPAHFYIEEEEYEILVKNGGFQRNFNKFIETKYEEKDTGIVWFAKRIDTILSEDYFKYIFRSNF